MPTIMLPKRKYTGGHKYVDFGLRAAAKDYPKAFDGKAPSHPSKGRTGNSNGRLNKVNKGGKRMECHHAITGHGPCACRN